MAVEAAVGGIVLVLAGVLAATPPPTAEPEPAWLVDGAAYRYHASLDGELAVGGGGTLRVQVLDRNGTPVAEETCGRPSACLRVSLEPPQGGRQALTMERAGDAYLSSPIVWTEAGSWTVTLVFQSADVYEDLAELPVQVRASEA